MTGAARRDMESERRPAFCKTLMRQRRAMVEILGFALCPAPAWDMLLALYLARCEKRPLFLLALCAASNAPVATAHRRIADLVNHGLIDRFGNSADRRQVELRLTDKGLELMDRIFEVCL